MRASICWFLSNLLNQGMYCGHYTGTLSFAAPFAVASVGAVTVNEANGRIYQLPATAVTDPIVFAAIALNHGDEISLIGGGGAGAATGNWCC